MTEYSIFLNGQEIEPEPDVYWIYAGSDLIWERKTGGELIPDDTFSTYLFTKTGMLAPMSLQKESVFYDVDGKAILTQDFSDMLADGEYASFLWYDFPLYKMAGPNDAGFTRDIPDYIEYSALKFARRQFTPALTDTAAQWSSYNSSIAKHLASYPTLISGNGGGGMIPLSRPMGYIEGAASGVSNNSMLAYVKDGALVTDAGFVVLSVCGDRMITADSVYISSGNSAYGHITERDLSGNVIKEITSNNQRLITYSDTANPRRICKVGDYYSYYATKSGKQVLHITDNLSTLYTPSSFWDGIPENAFYYGGKYYLISSEKGALRYGDAPDNLSGIMYPKDEEWGSYKINRPGSPGAYYLDRETGALYVIGVSDKQVNGKSNYKILKMDLEA